MPAKKPVYIVRVTFDASYESDETGRRKKNRPAGIVAIRSIDEYHFYDYNKAIDFCTETAELYRGVKRVLRVEMTAPVA